MAIRSSPNALVRACLQALALRGVMAWRTQAGAIPIQGRYVRMGEPGVPDILGVLPPSGRMLAVECKTGTGRLNDAQRAWHQRARDAGVAVCVVCDVQELFDFLDGK